MNSAQIHLARISIDGGTARQQWTEETKALQGPSPFIHSFIHSPNWGAGQWGLGRLGSMPRATGQENWMLPSPTPLNELPEREHEWKRRKMRERHTETRQTDRTNEREAFSPRAKSPLPKVGVGVLSHKFRPHWFVQGHRAAQTQREGDVILMRHMLAPDCSGCCVTLGESPHLSGPAEGMPASCTLRAGVRSI